jgi:hypothetical protein
MLSTAFPQSLGQPARRSEREDLGCGTGPVAHRSLDKSAAPNGRGAGLTHSSTGWSGGSDTSITILRKKGLRPRVAGLRKHPLQTKKIKLSFHQKLSRQWGVPHSDRHRSSVTARIAVSLFYMLYHLLALFSFARNSSYFGKRWFCANLPSLCF